MRSPSVSRTLDDAESKRQWKVRSFRVNFVYGLITLSCVGLILRLSYIQITKVSEFRSAAVTTTVNTVPVLPARGRIYDANGTLLAYDKPDESLYYTQIPGINTHVAQISQLARQLAPAFGVKPTAVENQILTNMSTNDYATISLFKNLSERELAFIGENAATLPGISVQVDSLRDYPFGDLAGHVLGYVGQITPGLANQFVTLAHYQENQIVGQSGLEYTYETYLQGKVGQKIEELGASGNVIDSAGYDPRPIAGYNIKLTLDAHLQSIAQESMQTAIDQYDAKNHTQITDAAAVVMNVQTGGILAMVSYPYIDPNWFTLSTVGKHANYLSTPGVYQNNAIENPHYPGSTVKPANMLTALKVGVITPNFNYFDASGPLYIGNHPITEDASYGWVDDIKAIAVSDDKFFYNVGLMLGKWLGSSGSYGGAPLGGFANLQNWRDTDFIRGIMDLVKGEMQFGLGQLTHIDLPGEVAGSFYIQDAQGYQTPLNVQQVQTELNKTGKYPNSGSPIDLAFMAFGQAQQFTPIELAQYLATIANGGKRLQPHLLSEVLPPGMFQSLKGVQQKPIMTFHTKVQAALKLNPTYLKLVQAGLYAVCNQPYGTAYSSFVGAPYKAAGKTGTATIYLNGQKTNNSVFMGYAPYNNPQIAVVVMVPGAGFGAETSAPITRTLMDAYFAEHHASFMPKSQWTTSAVPADWNQSAAYQVPERSH